MAKTPFERLYGNIVDALSFSAPLRKMRRELNARIDAPDTFAAALQAPISHPLGVNRWFKKRRMSIAESYLRVVRDLDSHFSRSRLDALAVMAGVALNPKSLAMPLNTARVQMALMKETVKNRYSKRRQLELLSDFSRSTGGQRQVISSLCDELNIVELPERGTRLADFSYGWDWHVHDMATFGRKNVTQLVIDAFIKGISAITIVYGSASDLDKMEEAVEAGGILGVRASLALEYAAMAEGLKFHFMAELPPMHKPEEVARFFSSAQGELGKVFSGLERNRSLRTESTRALLEAFNQEHLEGINEGWPDPGPYRLEPLSFEDFIAHFPAASVNRVHLSEYLYARLMPVLKSRQLRTRLDRAGSGQAGKELRKLVRETSPESLLERYFSGEGAGDYRTVFGDAAEVARAFQASGCRVKLIAPLEHGVESACHAVDLLQDCLSSVEVYNTQDAARSSEEELLAFAKRVEHLNIRRAEEGKKPCLPVCGSDATGRNPRIPGMGFICGQQVSGKYARRYLNRHRPLPAYLSALILAEGKPVNLADVATTGARRIWSMGKIATTSPWLSPGGQKGSPDTPGKSSLVSPLRAWRYFNPLFKELVYTAIGYTVASSFIGPSYGLLWLLITGVRNSIADLVAYKGSKLSDWSLRSINFDNVAQSLFWTGFSVPILGMVKSGFDSVWPWAVEGLVFNTVKFFFISFANGLYLASHNTLRGFDRKVVRANFFRSVIAWPFATVSAPLGNLLAIPSIVQAKIWSDVVAGFIEGGSKFASVIRLRRKNVKEILPGILAPQGELRHSSLLDLLYLFKEDPRIRSSLRTLYDPSMLVRLVLGKEAHADRPVDLAALRTALEDPALCGGLADFILSRYQEEEASDLIDLAEDTLPGLLSWLGMLETRLAKKDERRKKRGKA
jgi:hypothetical protein